MPVLTVGSARLIGMNLTADQAAGAIERHECPTCAAPAGSACRTRGGKTATLYHTARFILVPALREDLEIPVPKDRGPGRVWKAGEAPADPVAVDTAAGTPIRIGYARCSTAEQEIASQIIALRAARCHKIFSEKISTRIKVRPELEAALALAHQFKEAAPEQPVILTVHELKRLARNAAELMVLATQLQAADIQLEMLTGPLTGVYDPRGMGQMLFAVLAVAAQLERDYIREKTLEGQATAAEAGRYGGRPKAIDDDMLTFAVALREKGKPVPEIAGILVMSSGKNAGKHPSLASVYRALAEYDAAEADARLADTESPVPGPARPAELTPAG
jgi:DNA invertase Pin-like site-specific DNA recombinase